MTRRRVYLCAGLYAEGKSDYDVLLPLLNRLLDSLAAARMPGKYEVAETLGIDAPRPVPGGRAERIAAAITHRADECTLFVIHADGAGDPEDARQSRTDPGIAAARSALPGLVAAACVPAREIEAWMLADAEIFRTLLGIRAQPELIADPERNADPKQTLARIFREGGMQRRPEDFYQLVGEEVRFEALRGLSAFRRFEAELAAAIQAVATAQGAPG